MTRSEWVPATVAARRLGVKPKTVRRWVALGVIAGNRVPSYADGRCFVFVLRSALDAWRRDAERRA